jgi:diguanylate cyclase (GGDEF)-like protein
MKEAVQRNQWSARISRFAWIALGLVVAVHPSLAIGQTELRSLEAVHAIDNQQAGHEFPVSFEATVIYCRDYQKLLFVEDKDEAIFVFDPHLASFEPGDRVRITGKTAASFRPIVVASSVALIRHGEIPPAVPASFRELIRAQLDARRVSVQAKVRAADLVTSQNGERSARLQLNMEGGHLEAYVDSDDERALKSLLDTEVEITGAAAGKFDDKMEETGVVLYVSKLADIRVLKSAQKDPWTLKPTPIDQILSAFQVNDLSDRVRVVGTITYFQPGSAVVLESGSKSLWIATQSREPLRVGDIATAIGFPAAHDRVLSLVDAEIHDTGIQEPIPPHPATWEQLALWDTRKPVGHQFDLVTTDGEVIAEVRGALEDQYVLSAGGRLFSAIHRHRRGTVALQPMRLLPLHSRIRVTGICVISDTSVINPGEDVPFEILLRSFEDIELVADPPLLSVRNLLILVGVLVLLLLAVSVKAWFNERRASHQTANSAYMERKRAQILADINGKRPLSTILDDITQMVSFKLHGVPCWCQVSDGARIGNHPKNLSSFRVAEQKIHGLSGSELGMISAAIDRRTVPEKQEGETLATAAAVAALAIETRRLYSDLVHRSEFDQLTEIHNRFSFEQYLESQLLEAQNRGGMLGLIYIDLNDFKNVNDNFGHLVGDLYLCQAARRMKHQLRGYDMLGRLGGDEFGVLIPCVHNRGEVEDVVQRLERAFDDPFDTDGYRIQGSASFGFAMYPEDGASSDELLSAADAAMYVAKQTKKETEKRSKVLEKSIHPV